jgi:prepilin-type N-terminal cleavage/methylation domain-containing protein
LAHATPFAGSGRATRAARRARRAGYTLLEITVVVALMCVIAALTVPSLLSMFSDARVNASGDMILARIADARSMAMEQGKPFRFGFLPGTGQFMVAPDDSDEWHSASQSSQETETDEMIRGQLLEDVLFSTDMGSIRSDSGPSTGGGWQTGGVFLPNGSARAALNPDGTSVDDVTFYFGMRGQSPMGVRVRGFIGVVRVFDPTSDGEQP